MAEAVMLWFDADADTMDRPFWGYIQTKKDHGRSETRRYLVTNDVAWLEQPNQNWAGTQSLIMIKSTRKMIGRSHNGIASIERHYYLSSLPAKLKVSVKRRCNAPPPQIGPASMRLF